MLLLAAAATIFVVNGYAVAVMRLGTPGGFVAVLELLPVITSAVVMGGLAAFVLAGSPAARILGGLAALGGLMQLVLPVIAYRVVLDEAAWVVLLYGLAVVLHAATIVALLLPARSEGEPV